MNKITYFNGPDGVYYQPYNDSLWLIKLVIVKETFDFSTWEIKKYPMYSITNEEMENKILAIKFDKHFTFIGEL